jgi:hypothetical protein
VRGTAWPITGRPSGLGRENGGTAFVEPVLVAPVEPELPRVTALPVEPDEAVEPEELVAPLLRELPANPPPLLTCDPPPLDDDPPPPPLLPRGTADDPLKPPLDDPALLPPEDPPDEPPEDPPDEPPDEPLEEPPDEPPLPWVCWADETVGVLSKNMGTSTASAKPVHAGNIRFMALSTPDSQ